MPPNASDLRLLEPTVDLVMCAGRDTNSCNWKECVQCTVFIQSRIVYKSMPVY